jgi:hypothetical protein
VLNRPDVADACDNTYRRRRLDEHRAYERREEMFGGFPRRIEWFWAGLTPDEVLEILYIDWDWWLMVSSGSRRPRAEPHRLRAAAESVDLEAAVVAAKQNDCGTVTRSLADLRSRHEQRHSAPLRVHVAKGRPSAPNVNSRPGAPLDVIAPSVSDRLVWLPEPDGERDRGHQSQHAEQRQSGVVVLPPRAPGQARSQNS